MIFILIIIALLIFGIMCGLAAATTHLEIITKNQIEIIRVLKNK